MKDQSPKDRAAALMKHSLVELPFSDFDQRMMLQIRREASALAKSKKDKNLASLFFTLGCFSGVCLSNLLVFGYRGQLSNGLDKTVFQVAAVLLLLLFLNSVYSRFIKLRFASKDVDY